MTDEEIREQKRAAGYLEPITAENVEARRAECKQSGHDFVWVRKAGTGKRFLCCLNCGHVPTP